MFANGAYDPAQCDLCGETAADVVLDRTTLRAMTSDARIVRRALRKLRCRSCGLVRDGLGISGDELAGFYGEQYTLNTRSTEEHVFFTPEGPIPRSAMIADWIVKLVPPHRWTAGQRVLEVGCGQGNLLRALATRMPDVEFSGVELSAEATRRARDQGLDAHCGDTEAAPHELYDRILVFGVLEHVPSPTAFLHRLRARLPIDGELVLGQPTQDVANYDIFFVDHLHHFASAHVDLLATKAGFEPVAAEIGHPLDDDMSLHVFRAVSDESSHARIDLPIQSTCEEAAQRFTGIFERVDALLAKCAPSERLAVFGIGEIFVLLLAYTALAKRRIVCGLDDDEARQRDERWPFPIAPPERAGEFGVDRVLLCVNPTYAERITERLAALDLRVDRLF